jgi:hypothetical protein
MPLHNITESDSFPVNVQMPADGDSADASDFEASTTGPLANRTRWLYNRVNPIWAGGTVTPAGALNLSLLSGHLTINSNDDWGLMIGPNAKLFANGRIGNHCFDGDGGYGRANKRVRIENLGADGTFDPTLHDRALMTPVGAHRSFQVLTSITPEIGDHCVVVNYSATYQITVKNQLGNTMIILAPNTVPAWAEVIWDGTFWIVGPSFPGA